MSQITFPTAESEEELDKLQREQARREHIEVCPYCLNLECECSDFDICGDFGDK